MLARRSASSIVGLAMLFAGCSSSEGAGGDGALDVVASFYPLAEAARQVGGTAADVRDLTPAGVEPHDLELRPSDIGRLRSADLILYIGDGFQPALEDAIEALPDPSTAVDLLDGLALRSSSEEGGPADPHVWLDPVSMSDVVARIATEMGERRPGDRLTFESGSVGYRGLLATLHRDFERTLRTCARREFVTAHAAFGYLGARYELEQIAISGVTPESEPSPRRLEEVATLAQARGVTTIFFETLVDPRVAQAVARTVGARTAVLNPIEGLTDEQADAGESYVTLMRANLAALAAGLRCEGG